MRYEVLTSDHDLTEYSDQTAHVLQLRLPLEYLRRCKVIAYRSKTGKIVAGYCLALKPPFRALLPVPPHVYQNMLWSIEKTIEVNGLWIATSYRGGFFAMGFWIRFLLNALGTKKKFIVYSYSASKSALAKFYSRGNPTKIWIGDVQIEGMEKKDWESVEFVPLYRLVYWTANNISSKFLRRWSIPNAFLDFMPINSTKSGLPRKGQLKICSNKQRK